MASKTRSAKRAQKKAQDDRRVIVSTSRGHRVECLPVATLIDEIQQAYQDKMPTSPIRIITDVAGSEMEVPYNDETIGDADVPEEVVLAYAEYKTESATLDAERNENVLRAVAVRGVNILTMPDDDSWIELHEWLGMTVPESPHERLYHYFKTEIIGTEADGVAITAGIYRASGVDEEVISQMEASFRDSVGGSEGADADGNPAQAEAGESEETARVVGDSQ